MGQLEVLGWGWGGVHIGIRLVVHGDLDLCDFPTLALHETVILMVFLVYNFLFPIFSSISFIYSSFGGETPRF